MIKRSVAGLTHGVSAAVSLARHPLATAANAAGLVKGTVQTAHGLVRGNTGDKSSSPGTETKTATDFAAPAAPEKAATEKPVVDEVEEFEAHEPQVVLKPVPTIDELPEPVVIYADDSTDTSTGASTEVPPAADLSESDEPEAEVVWTSESTGADRA